MDASTLQDQLRTALEQLSQCHKDLREQANQLESLRLELQQTEEQLRVNEDRSRAFLNATSATAFRLSSNWDSVHILDQDKWVTHQAASADSLLENFVHPDDIPLVAERMVKAIDSKVPFAEQHRTLRADGTVAWVSSKAIPILSQSGEIIEWLGTSLDITSHKEIERALRESENRYRTLFESIDEGCCVFDMIHDEADQPSDFRFVEVNPAFERITGFTDVVGKTGLELMPLRDGFWIPFFGEVARTGIPARVQHCVQGRLCWYDVYAFRVGAPEERRVAALFTDITERMLVQDSLRASEERLQKMINIGAVGVLIFRDDGTLIDANDSMLEMIGYAREELKTEQITWRTLTPPEWVGVSESQMEMLQRTGRLGPYEKEYLCSDGTRRWMIFAGADMNDGTIVEYCIDIHDRKLAESKIREHEKQFRNLVEQIQDYAIFMLDLQGRPSSWNEGVKRVLGFHENEFVSQDVFHSIFTPEDVAAGVPEQELQSAAESGRASDDRWMLRQDGSRFWASGITTALRDEKHDLVGFMKVMRDQTDRKVLEDQLRKIAGDLAEVNRRKDEFLATLAHEIRNPLAPIRTGLDFMKTAFRQEPIQLGVIEEVRLVMQRQTQQLVRLFDDLLDLSRITRGKIELRKRETKLEEIIRNAVEACQSAIQEAGHQLSIEPLAAPIAVNADPHRLTQVISNLLSNAAKFTDRGGSIWVKSSVEDGFAVISVKDSGIGIPPEMQDRVFEMFTQLKGHGAESGLGIGLTLVKSLVELHEGQVEVFSEGIDRGTTITIRIPGVVAHEARAEKNSDNQAINLQGHRILVVDDTRAGIFILRKILESHGCEVREAHDGQMAIDAAREYRPDAIVMDIGMPMMDGYEAARRIRAEDWGKSITLIALTGWGREEDRQRSREAGFDHHLVKPPEPDLLRKLISTAKK